MTQAQMRDQIVHERALEFCFESQRYIDLLRWGWFEDSARLDLLKSRDSNFNNYTAGKEYLPIPSDALNSNPNLVQNAGW